MEMKNVNCEIISAAETKCVKRGRRDSSAVAESCNDQKSEEQKQQPLGDQSTVSSTAATAKRSSRFRGVSRHRWTGRYEAHLWDKGSWNTTQRKKGKQVYLGAYDEEESAARAYDLAALKYWGTSTTTTNFPVSDYEHELEIMKTMTREEYLASLRRRSSGFSRGVSKYRGVARHHHNGRWEARIGRVFGNKYLYLGTYSTQEEAAHAYDIAAIEYRGINAVTNFDLNTYIRRLRPAANSLPPQEPKSSPDPRLIAPSSSNHIPNQEIEPSSIIFPINHFKSGNLSTPQTPISPSTTSSSSPTALSILLRSSIFKELMERNLNANGEETEEADTKNLEPIGNISEGNFYGEIDNFPDMCSSGGDVLPGLESREANNNALPLYNKTGHSLWSGALNFSSSNH